MDKKPEPMLSDEQVFELLSLADQQYGEYLNAASLPLGDEGQQTEPERSWDYPLTLSIHI